MRIVVYQRAKEDMPFVQLALCASRAHVVPRVEGGPAGSAAGTPA